MFNEVSDIAQFDLVNSRTFKDLWNEIQGLSSTCPVFKYFQGIEFRRKKFKYFQGLSMMRGNPAKHKLYTTPSVNSSNHSPDCGSCASKQLKSIYGSATVSTV